MNSVILNAATRLLVALMLLFSIYMLLRGHNEPGGGFIGALRYGSGTLHHKIEGTRQVHWTGPSIGFEIGGNAAKVFTLVYNLYDTEDIFRRYPAVEGQFYFVAGLGVNYHQRDDVILAPIRTGIGVRATANVGYLKYTPDRKFNPF